MNKEDSLKVYTYNGKKDTQIQKNTPVNDEWRVLPGT